MSSGNDGAATGLSPPGGRPERSTLRAQLLDQRDRWAAAPDHAARAGLLGHHLCQVLRQLEPTLLGLYWPLRSEFNAAAAVAADSFLSSVPAALPFASTLPVSMVYRAWDGRSQEYRDECGIPTSDGPVVTPDVVIVPCVGFTAFGYRLGQGGGYFDRWLATHPATTAIGVAGAYAEIPAGAFAPEPHDIPLTLIVTENGVVGG